MLFVILCSLKSEDEKVGVLVKNVKKQNIAYFKHIFRNSNSYSSDDQERQTGRKAEEGKKILIAVESQAMTMTGTTSLSQILCEDTKNR